MPRTIPIQTSFAGGELSPKLRGRVDTDLWKKGLDECINFEPLAHGPLLSRGGTRHAVDFDDLTSKCRLIEFPRQGDVGFLLVLGGGTGLTPGAMRVRNGKTGSQEVGGLDYLKNSRFTYGLQWWEVPGGVYCMFGRVFIGPTNIGPTHLVYQTSAVNALGAGTYEVVVTGSTAAGNTLAFMVGTTGSGSTDLISDSISTAGLSDKQTKNLTFTLAAPATVTMTAMSANENSEEIAPHQPAACELVEMAVRQSTAIDVAWDQTTTPKMPWGDDQLEALQVVAEPAKDRVMFFHPEVDPYELAYEATTGNWSFGKITFTFNAPLDPDWESPNFPGVAELYQGRLLVGGIPGKRNTLLGSKSGDAYNFTSNTPPNADDAFSLDISTKGGIRWMHGHRTLLLGTDRGEHIVMAQGGVLTPSDFEVRPQSGFGSAAVQAVAVGDQAMYVSRDRRRLRMLSFNLQENGWQTRDLTFTSEHLTGGLIQDMDWLSTGNDQVYGLMRSGEVVAWTFNRPENIIAPWQCDFGASLAPAAVPDFGKVYALCVLEAGDQDKVWVLVHRVGTVCLEEWLVSDDDSGRCLLDSHVVATPAGGSVTGLSWLDGVEVTPLAGFPDVDGNLEWVAQAPQTVTGGGAITVDADATSVIVGVYAPRSFTTLPKEGGQPGGTAAGSKQRMVKLSLRLNDSAIPLVDGVRAAPDRTPATPMGTVEPRITADVTSRLLGWESHGAVTVTQDKPIRTEVLALYGVLSTSEV